MPSSSSAAALDSQPAYKLSDDELKGIPAIAEFLGVTARRAYYLCERQQVPAFKLKNSNVWRLRRSTYLNHIQELEAATVAGATRNPSSMESNAATERPRPRRYVRRKCNETAGPPGRGA